MNVPDPCDTNEEGNLPTGWAVELTDLDLVRLPGDVIRGLDGTDAAVVDGVRLRRHDHRHITAAGHGTRPRWLA